MHAQLADWLGIPTPEDAPGCVENLVHGCLCLGISSKGDCRDRPPAGTHSHKIGHRKGEEIRQSDRG
jgi:hypothetical protein